MWEPWHTWHNTTEVEAISDAMLQQALSLVLRWIHGKVIAEHCYREELYREKLFQPHCSVHLDRASTGLENLFAYLFTVSFMHFTCDDQTKFLACGGTIWWFCDNNTWNLHDVLLRWASLPSFNADPYVAVPLNNASVSEPFSCFLYNSLDVDNCLS